jgi:hypothetical protein
VRAGEEAARAAACRVWLACSARPERADVALLLARESRRSGLELASPPHHPPAAQRSHAARRPHKRCFYPASRRPCRAHVQHRYALTPRCPPPPRRCHKRSTTMAPSWRASPRSSSSVAHSRRQAPQTRRQVRLAARRWRRRLRRAAAVPRRQHARRHGAVRRRPAARQRAACPGGGAPSSKTSTAGRCTAPRAPLRQATRPPLSLRRQQTQRRTPRTPSTPAAPAQRRGARRQPRSAWRTVGPCRSVS